MPGRRGRGSCPAKVLPLWAGQNLRNSSVPEIQGIVLLGSDSLRHSANRPRISDPKRVPSIESLLGQSGRSHPRRIRHGWHAPPCRDRTNQPHRSLHPGQYRGRQVESESASPLPLPVHYLNLSGLVSYSQNQTGPRSRSPQLVWGDIQKSHYGMPRRKERCLPIFSRGLRFHKRQPRSVLQLRTHLRYQRCLGCPASSGPV